MSELDFARQFLEDLLSFFGLNTKVDATREDDTIQLNVPSSEQNGFLIGQHGDNLRSLQHLTNMALKRSGTDGLAVVVDVAGYKAQRSERLSEHVKKLAGEVIASDAEKTLEPMSSYERRVVHKTVSEIDGVESESVGEGRDRRVVIKTNKPTE